ncbi:MAG: hypothetical protein JW815_04810 [Candidatus Bathyarchaeota archaeon]|nr:hypothetical protein [Candidatus Bathyarchaeum sp.]
MLKHPKTTQKLAEKKMQPETYAEKPKRELPIWCRGIMGGCVNCGGCV